MAGTPTAANHRDDAPPALVVEDLSVDGQQDDNYSVMIYSTAKSSPNDAAIVDAKPAKPSKGAVPLDTVIPITGVPVAPPTPPQQTQGLPLGDDDEWMSPEMKLGEMQEDLLVLHDR